MAKFKVEYDSGDDDGEKIVEAASETGGPFFATFTYVR